MFLLTRLKTASATRFSAIVDHEFRNNTAGSTSGPFRTIFKLVNTTLKILFSIYIKLKNYFYQFYEINLPRPHIGRKSPYNRTS